MCVCVCVCTHLEMSVYLFLYLLLDAGSYKQVNILSYFRRLYDSFHYNLYFSLECLKFSYLFIS